MKIRVLLLISVVFFLGCVTTKVSDDASRDYNVSVAVKSTDYFYGKDNFCGVSTYGECTSDSQCRKGGCSSQVCQSVNEEQVFTTCEYQQCYDASKYKLRCRCFDNRCQWAQ